MGRWWADQKPRVSAEMKRREVPKGCGGIPVWLQRSRSWWSESGDDLAVKLTPEPKLQRSRSWWSESGWKNGITHGSDLLLQRSRSWWSESGCGSRRAPHRQTRGYNEVAPGGASQASEGPSMRFQALMLQRSRTWWSESGD